MNDGKDRILSVLNLFTGRDGEPGREEEVYILKAMWLMMLSEFEASLKLKAESYIDRIKENKIEDIHVCLLIRNFFGNKKEELTANKIIALYKKSPDEIRYRNFTKDRVPKYKPQAVEKLFNNLGIFFSEDDISALHFLNSVSSTRDSIAHGDINVQITRKELEERLEDMINIMQILEEKLLAT